MKEVLRNVWKGSLLGFITAFMWGEMFVIVFIVYEVIRWGYSSLEIIFNIIVFGQIIAISPAIFIGLTFGGIIGIIFSYFFKNIAIRFKKVIIVVFALILHGLFVLLVFGLISGMFGASRWITMDWDLYHNYWFIVLPIYLLSSIWFANRFYQKDIWTPAFLKEKSISE